MHRINTGECSKEMLLLHCGFPAMQFATFSEKITLFDGTQKGQFHSVAAARKITNKQNGDMRAVGISRIVRSLAGCIDLFIFILTHNKLLLLSPGIHLLLYWDDFFYFFFSLKIVSLECLLFEMQCVTLCNGCPLSIPVICIISS